MSKLDLLAINTLLRDNGVHYVGCYYSGGGDSGGIDTYIYEGHEFKDKYDSGDIQSEWGVGGSMVNELQTELGEEKIKHLENSLDDIFNKQLNNVEDWWNNEGGYGTMMMDTLTGEFKIINNTYYTETDTHNHKGKIENII